jgi:hypothetical protein
MMLTAVLAAMPPALFRIDPVRSLFVDSLLGKAFGPFAPALVLGLIFLIVKWVLFRRFDRWLATGWAALVASGALLMLIATTSWWDRLTSALV